MHGILVQYSAPSFNFQYPFVSFWLSTSCIRLIPCRPVIYIIPSIFPWTLFYKALPTQDVTQPSFFLIYIGYYFAPRLHTILHFSQDRSNRSPSFPSITFQNFPGDSDLFSEVSKFQHHESHATNVALY
jgi:hypothetical protein